MFVLGLKSFGPLMLISTNFWTILCSVFIKASWIRSHIFFQIHACLIFPTALTLGLQSAAQYISALHHLPTSFLSGRHFVFSLHFGMKLLVLERPNASCLHQFSVCFTNWKSIYCSPRVPTNRCRLEAYASTPFSSSAITYWTSSPITPDFSTLVSPADQPSRIQTLSSFF